MQLLIYKEAANVEKLRHEDLKVSCEQLYDILYKQ